MRYRLRTLLIAMAIGPMVIAGAWFTAKKAIAAHRRRYASTEHLKQIGLGLQNYSSVYYYNMLPPGARWRNGSYPASLPPEQVSPTE